jgi:hypothetical protein
MSRLRREFRKGSKGFLLQNRKKKIKDAGKSLTRGTNDLSATRVLQGPAAGSNLIVASKKITPEPKRQRSGGSRMTAGKVKAIQKRKEDSKPTPGAGTATRGSTNQKTRELAKRREAWKANRPNRSDFKNSSGRNLTVSERAKFNKALKDWQAKEPK